MSFLFGIDFIENVSSVWDERLVVRMKHGLMLATFIFAPCIIRLNHNVI